MHGEQGCRVEKTKTEGTAAEKTKGAVAEKTERPLVKKTILQVAALDKCFVPKSKIPQVVIFVARL